jgi:hypothetical protein
MNYDKCLAQKGDARLTCQLDKALTNVGSLLAARVEGRVCTEIDPRLANDAGKQLPGSIWVVIQLTCSQPAEVQCALQSYLLQLQVNDAVLVQDFTTWPS